MLKERLPVEDRNVGMYVGEEILEVLECLLITWHHLWGYCQRLIRVCVLWNVKLVFSDCRRIR